MNLFSNLWGLASLSQILGMFHVYASVCKLKWHVTFAAVRGAHLSAAQTVSWHLANLAQGQARWSCRLEERFTGLEKGKCHLMG